MAALDFPSPPTDGQKYGGYYWDASTGAWRSDPVPMGGLPAGSIIQWAGATAPANWLMADGAAVSRTTYASLFAAIGTTYGAGDGSTTFNLPDLRGRVAVGKNGGTFGTLGATGGAETVALTQGQMPVHSHATQHVYYQVNFGNTAAPYPAAGDLTPSQSGFKNISTGNAGNGEAHNNLQPYIVTNYIIKATSGWSAGDSELATRVGVLEAAPAGLVRVVPTSVAVGSGTASTTATGAVSFSGASSVSLNGCFSGTFTNYRAVIEVTSRSTPSFFNIAMRLAGSNDASANYDRTTSYTNSSTPASYASTGGSIWTHAVTNTARGTMHLELFSPAVSTFTTTQAQFSEVTPGSALFWGSSHGIHRVASGFDGISLIAAAGNMTGTVQVYGYRN